MTDMGNNHEEILVSAALIVRNGRILACRRHAGERHPGRWEFPGGKMKSGEDPRDALQRELQEELGVEAEVGELFIEIRHSYDYGNVHLMFFRVDIGKEEPVQLHHSEIRWVRREELSTLPFLPADEELVEMIAGGEF